MTQRSIVFAALIMTGCAADEATPTPDAPVDTPRCDPSKPFGVPELIRELHTPGDETGARLTADELTIFFASTQDTAGDGDLFRATRTSVDEPFDNIERLTSLETAGDERAPDPARFGSYLVFERDGDILTSDADGSTFTAPTPLESVSTASEERAPYLVDGALYLSVDGELMNAPRFWGFLLSPVPVFEPSIAGTDPVLDRDEGTLLFARQRSNSAATEIWASGRDPQTGAFTTPSPVIELADPAASMAPSWLSEDGCTLYLESNAGGDFDLYVARRPR